MKKLLITFSFFVAGFVLGTFSDHREQAVQVVEVSTMEFDDSPVVELVSVYDGDTITVNIEGWPDIIGHRISIRLKGVDTPEIRDSRESIKEKARQAKMFVVEKLRSSSIIKLQNLERDKYFRIAADVYVDGQKLSEILLEKGLAKKYDGGTKPEWD